jgi:hypothetical protein
LLTWRGAGLVGWKDVRMCQAASGVVVASPCQAMLG